LHIIDSTFDFNDKISHICYFFFFFTLFIIYLLFIYFYLCYFFLYIPKRIGWFAGGKLNVCYNALDRHLKESGENIALIYDSPVTNTIKKFTYFELHALVSQFAGIVLFDLSFYFVLLYIFILFVYLFCV
jgi:hypothetical protein